MRYAPQISRSCDENVDELCRADENEMSVQIEPMAEADWLAVVAIYREGIATGHATFTAEPPTSYSAFCDGAISAGSLVARNGEGVVLGWTRITRVSSRAVYAGV